MTLTQMRYFYEVCKWRSITKAAASLHISQPTVSIAMADLEKESGLNLFRREGKKLSLTEDGSLLLSKITPILANLQQLDRDIKDMARIKTSSAWQYLYKSAYSCCQLFSAISKICTLK